MRDSIYSGDGIRLLLEEAGYAPNKALGQNFLIDKNAVERIIDVSGAEDKNVLEIGPGLGSLTFRLNDIAKTVTAVDVDAHMTDILKAHMDDFSHPDTLNIVCADFLKPEISDIVPHDDIVAVANLPYYITTPACMKLIRAAVNVRSMTLMMQDEAAHRFFAKPSDKQYGPLTVLARYAFDTVKVFDLSPASYYPQPEVDSVVLHMERRDFDPGTLKKLDTVLKQSFLMRRKTLTNNLLAAGYKKESILNALEHANLHQSVRAEALELADYLKIIDVL